MNGRYNRAKYFVTVLLISIATQILFAILIGDPIGNKIGAIVLIAGFILSSFQVVKRFHDLGRPGSHYWLLLIPIYNIYLGFVLLLKKGAAGHNEYGADPLAHTTHHVSTPTQQETPQSDSKNNKWTPERVAWWKESVGQIILGVVVVGLVLWQLNSCGNNSTKETVSSTATLLATQTGSHTIPDTRSQMEFERNRSSFAEQYKSGINEIQKSKAYRDANEWSLSFAKSIEMQAKNWVGKIGDISTDKGGNSASMWITSNNNGFRIMYSNYGINNGSKVYNALANLSEGDVVYFSFQFKSDDETGIKNNDLTESGAITDPDLDVTITYIGKQPEP